MSWTSATSGTWSPGGTTEETVISAQTTNGTYVLVVDTAALANGETLEFWIKTKHASGGTSRIAYHVAYSHAQGEPNKYSVPVPVDTELLVTGKVSNASRTFPYNLLRQ